ncbi:hypothetical protein [Planctomycetes bacterium TBK1r]|uniref:hypothetical protein n=1 Tax=Stieleria magnilauensis TaxID=2527963 RepID=UPI0011AA2DB2
MLNSLPRDFTITYNYTPSATGLSTVSGTFTFLANTSDPQVTVATTGNFAMANNAGTSGQDIFSVDGIIAAGLLGPSVSRYTFAFVKPTNTISSNNLSPLAVAQMIAGPTSINFKSGPVRGFGVVRGAPEPNTMVALSGFVIAGCGIGYRRRLKKHKETAVEASEA